MNDEGIEKYTITFLHVNDKETGATLQSLQEVVRADLRGREGITMDGGVAMPALNIPVSVVNDISESGAQHIFETLAPLVQRHLNVKSNKDLLHDLAGEKWHVRRTAFGEDGAPVYVLNFLEPIHGRFDPVRRLSGAVNKVLGENPPLFEGFTIEGHTHIGLIIQESDMEKLRANPNLAQLIECLQNPEHAVENNIPLLKGVRRIQEILSGARPASGGEIAR
jgi:hypothetical protein